MLNNILKNDIFVDLNSANYPDTSPSDKKGFTTEILQNAMQTLHEFDACYAKTEKEALDKWSQRANAANAASKLNLKSINQVFCYLYFSSQNVLISLYLFKLNLCYVMKIA